MRTHFADGDDPQRHHRDRLDSGDPDPSETSFCNLEESCERRHNKIVRPVICGKACGVYQSPCLSEAVGQGKAG